MLRITSIATGVFVCAIAFAQQAAINGQWSIGGPLVQNKIDLSIRRTTGNPKHGSSGAVELALLKG